MWLSRLPGPGDYIFDGGSRALQENILFTEKISRPYYCEDQPASFGVIFLYSGDATFTINDRKEKLDRDNFYVVNHDSRLSIKTRDSHPALLFFRDELPEIISHTLLNRDDQLLDRPQDFNAGFDFSLLEKAHRANERFRTQMTLLSEFAGSSSSFAALKADCLARDILENIISLNLASQVQASRLTALKRSTRIELHRRISIAKDWMDEQFHQPLSLRHLGRISNMNSQHFLRTFKQVFRETPHQYLIRKRLDRALYLLKVTEMPVSEICRACGFESASSFSGLFRKKFGCAPSLYRRKKD